jgi:hypothetical protein
MSQSKKYSLIEQTVNIVLAYCFALFMYMLILPLFGFDMTWNKGFAITAIFATVNFARGYIVRRIFNRIGK